MFFQFGKFKATSRRKFAVFVEQRKELDDHLKLHYSYSSASRVVAKSKT